MKPEGISFHFEAPHRRLFSRDFGTLPGRLMMNIASHSEFCDAVPAEEKRDAILTSSGFGPLTDNDDDGGDHTTEVEPDF